MSTRGPKPKPRALRILDGDQPSRINPSEPRPLAVPPMPPDDLDATGRAAWDRLAPMLSRLGLLTEADGEALALYCRAAQVAARAEAQVRRYGLSMKDGAGGRRPNPAVAMAERARRDMLAVLTEFGLTPSSRSRVKVEAPPRDALADFLAGRPA